MIFTNGVYQKENPEIISIIHLLLVNKLFLHHLVISYDSMIVHCWNAKWLMINTNNLFLPSRMIEFDISQCKWSGWRRSIQRVMFVESLKRKKSNKKHTAANKPMNQTDSLVRWIEEECHLRQSPTECLLIGFELAREYSPKTLDYDVAVDQRPIHTEFFVCFEKQSCWWRAWQRL